MPSLSSPQLCPSVHVVGGAVGAGVAWACATPHESIQESHKPKSKIITLLVVRIGSGVYGHLFLRRSEEHYDSIWQQERKMLLSR